MSSYSTSISEYRTAFPSGNHIDIDSLVLPYWLLNSEELQDMFIESNEEQSYNQIAILKKSITDNRREHFDGTDAEKELLHYDSPTFFDIHEVMGAVRAKNEEMVPGANNKERKGHSMES